MKNEPMDSMSPGVVEDFSRVAMATHEGRVAIRDAACPLELEA